ncbi:MAG: DUF501 domain-containing protein [Limnochordia bacterium]|nr:DUF501 domain-containing protein [Limnochordia bacterium]
MHTSCGYGYPQVIVTRPVSATYSGLEIFPTLYWLTCPYLCKELALLEAEGLIAHFEQRIQAEPEFADLVKKNHESYAQHRLALIPMSVRENIREEYPDRYRVLAETGVGGIRGFEGVKCLHTHVADYLAQGENPIGAEAVAVLSKPLDCPSQQCEEFTP